MGKNVQALWSTTIKMLPPHRVVIRPSGCTRSLHLPWIADLPCCGYRVCLCISVCCPYFPNLFDLVSGLCSKVSFLSEILECWFFRSSHVLGAVHSGILRILLWLTLAGLHSKTTGEYFLLGSSLLASAGFEVLYPKHTVTLIRWRWDSLWDSQACICLIHAESLFLPCFRLCAVFMRVNPETRKTLARA